MLYGYIVKKKIYEFIFFIIMFIMLIKCKFIFGFIYNMCIFVLIVIYKLMCVNVVLYLIGIVLLLNRNDFFLNK